jgi:Predicted transcriptional regulators
MTRFTPRSRLRSSRESSPRERRLPSIRALAKDLRISVITTKRAYDELEADGFLFTVAGKGCFVAEKNLDLIREQKLKELEDHLDAAVELAAQCGVSSAQLQEMLRILLREEGTHERD